MSKTPQDQVNDKLAANLSVGTALLDKVEQNELAMLGDESEAVSKEFYAISKAGVITALDLRYVEAHAQQLLNWVAYRRGL